MFTDDPRTTLPISFEDQPWISIQEFRAAHMLPPDFGLRLFAPKDFTNLGSIDRAGDALHQVREHVLNYIPSDIPPRGVVTFGLELQLHFHRLLREINPVVGLHPSEIEYASAGFGDVIQAYLHTLLKAYLTDQPMPDFNAIYHDWLTRSTLVSSVSFPYEHQGEMWRVRLVKNNYGLVGMIVHTDTHRYYVSDLIYSCPAAGFMTRLLQDCAQRLEAIIIQN